MWRRCPTRNLQSNPREIHHVHSPSLHGRYGSIHAVSGRSGNMFRQSSVHCSVRLQNRTECGALRALNLYLQDLDPNSCLMDSGMLKELKIGTSENSAVWDGVTPRGGDYVVISPFEGSPAYKAGIKAGDMILEIDGQPLHGLPLLEVPRKVRGPSGSIMSVRVKQARTDTLREFKIRRRIIQIPPERSR